MFSGDILMKFNCGFYYLKIIWGLVVEKFVGNLYFWIYLGILLLRKLFGFYFCKIC